MSDMEEGLAEETSEEIREILSDISDPVEKNGHGLRKRLNQAMTEIETLEKNLEEEIRERSGSDENYIGRYIKLEILGEGGMGIVYKAFDPMLKRLVAIKLMNLRDEEGLKRFRSEAEILASLKHRNIVPIYETGVHEERPFHVMEYIDGGNLKDRIGLLSVDDCLRIIEKVADAVNFAHLNGVIHMDIKPQNILLDSDGEVYITDFGIARKTGVMSRDNTIMGTPSYMSPEQAMGLEATRSSDIFSLGATLYHCVTETAPFGPGPDSSIMRRIIDGDFVEPARLNATMPADIGLIIKKCLQSEPASRYASAAELRDDIRRFLAGDAITARECTVIYQVYRWLKKNALKLSLWSAGACAAASLLFFGIKYRSEYLGLLEEFFSERVHSSAAPLGKHPTKHVKMDRLRRPGAAEDQTKYEEEFAEAFNSRSGEIRAAVTGYEHGKSRFDAMFEAVRLGRFDEISGILEDSVAGLATAIKEFPAVPEPYYIRGLISLLKRDYEEAISDFSKALDLDPGLADARYMRIIARYRQLFWRRYYRPFRRVVLKPETRKLIESDLNRTGISGANKLLVEALLNRVDGADELALRAAESAVLLEPSLADGYEVRGQLYYMRSMPFQKAPDEEAMDYRRRAIEDFRVILCMKPKIPPDYLWLAEMSEGLKEFDLARRFVEILLKIDKDDLVANAMMADICINSGDRETGLQYLETIERLEREQRDIKQPGQLYYMKGLLLAYLGRMDEARENLEKWCDHAPDPDRLDIIYVHDFIILPGLESLVQPVK